MSSPGRQWGLLQRLPVRARTGLFLGALVVTLVALFTPGLLGAFLVAVIVVALAYLMSRTWAVAAPRTRVVRVVVLAVFIAFAIYKATH